MAIVNQEARAERARQLYTVPTAMSPDRLDAACQPALVPSLYDADAAGNLALQKQPHQLTDSERYRILECLRQPAIPNGIERVEVRLVGDVAELEVHFFNQNYLGQIVQDLVANDALVRTTFPISGGHRLPAGPAAGQVQVVQLNSVPADPAALTLTVAPVGDYSTYTVGVDTLAYPNFDPVFNDVPFKFRPGCFNTNCAPEWEPGAPREPAPVIDYLAKDYDSFRHTMIAAMMERVPGWQPTSEADLDQVLLDLFSAAADELSDYQDRVMNEAYLATARRRVSLARHARLMDYHIHQGNQASTWVALELRVTPAPLPPPAPPRRFWLKNGFKFWAGADKDTDPRAVVFVARDDAGDGQPVHPFFNRFGLYTWSNSAPALAAGSTTADLRVAGPPEDEPTAKMIRDLVREGTMRHLLIQEYLNPATGTANGRDPNKRQLLRLLPGAAGAEALHDPLLDKWLVRVRWREEDRLRHNYCFTVECPRRVEDVSLFHGNLVRAFHGRPTEAPVVFREPGAALAAANEFHYEPTRWGTLCRLPKTLSPLAYRSTEPGGDVAPLSTLSVTVSPGGSDPWDEVPSLIHSDASDENGDHFVVETDEQGRSLIRFGNGTNGKRLPEGAVVACDFQFGAGLDGNIGLDQLAYFDRAAAAVVEQAGAGPKTTLDAAHGALAGARNPFDVTDGRAPEPAAEIIRRVPEAYRARQLRAVTLKDYVRRAQEVAGVSRAAAAYAWTGSWRTVRITIDPAGTNTLTDALRRDVARYLEAVRLIGEDLEIRPPLFVPLDVRVALCAGPGYWPEDLRFQLEQEFSAGLTPDGRRGFFHPDRWTFGQPLHASQIMGVVEQVEGVEHVISVRLKRWNAPTPPGGEFTRLRPNEIIEVLSDPDHLERGFIFFDIRGGRQ